MSSRISRPALIALIERFLRRAVKIVMHLGPFGKFTARLASLELGLAKKSIVPPMAPHPDAGARVVQETDSSNFGINFPKPVVEGRLAGAGGRRQDKNDPLPLGQLR